MDEFSVEMTFFQLICLWQVFALDLVAYLCPVFSVYPSSWLLYLISSAYLPYIYTAFIFTLSSKYHNCFAFSAWKKHFYRKKAFRLATLSVMSIKSLWRLFRGRKYNPLRQRVDSIRLHARQLFIATLFFIILLFLFPTILVYFFMFSSVSF